MSQWCCFVTLLEKRHFIELVCLHPLFEPFVRHFGKGGKRKTWSKYIHQKDLWFEISLENGVFRELHTLDQHIFFHTIKAKPSCNNNSSSWNWGLNAYNVFHHKDPQSTVLSYFVDKSRNRILHNVLVYMRRAWYSCTQRCISAQDAGKYLADTEDNMS